MTDTSATSSPFNMWWGIAAGALLIVLIVGVLLITGVLGGGPDPAPTTPSATTAPTENPPPAGATACEVPGGNDSIPTSGPDAEWATNIYFLYPTSDTFGPVENPSSSLWGCFQKSPAGALFAAANVASLLSTVDYEAAAAEAVVPNAALESWLAAQEGVSREQTPGRVAQIAGFQFSSVTPDAVTVSLGLRQEDVAGSMTMTMVWDDTSENWKLDLAQSDLEPVAANVDIYTAWRAS